VSLADESAAAGAAGSILGALMVVAAMA
jgi:hypothetical protein